MKQENNQKSLHFKDCRDLNLNFWECPTAMFLFMSCLTVISLITTYFVASYFSSPEVVIVSISVVTVMMMVINFSINNGLNKAAQSKRNLEDTNNKLAKTLVKLKEAEKAKEEFMYTIVHDLRSPLNGIRMLSEMINRGKNMKIKAKEESIRLINQGAVQLTELVNDLLDFSKLEAGRFKIKKQKNKIEEILANVVSYYLPMADSKDLKLNTNIAAHLPEIWLDKQGVEQILHNLLSNALKYTENGQINIDAFIHQQNKDINEEASQAKAYWQTKNKKLNKLINSIVIAISDTGLGIPENQQRYLFKKYSQINQDKNNKIVQPKSTGLGLFIAKGIVEAHKGIIGLESKAKAGSTFYFTIPL